MAFKGERIYCDATGCRAWTHYESERREQEWDVVSDAYTAWDFCGKHHAEADLKHASIIGIPAETAELICVDTEGN